MWQIPWSCSVDCGVSCCGNYPKSRLLAVALVPNTLYGIMIGCLKISFITHSLYSVLVPVDGVMMLLLDPLFFLFSLAAVEAGKAVLSSVRKLKKKKG